jgi:hypothetical protein
MIKGGWMMGTWFWLNIPVALLFVCCWAGIPMGLLLTRWHTEVEAKHAEVKARHAELEVRTVPEPVVARPAPATTAYQTPAPSL